MTPLRPRPLGRLLVLAVTLWAGPAAAASPDILLVSVDTLRVDRMSSYGHSRLTSPAIDGLLARGARFADARTVEPLTAPALASMLTSLEPHEHGATRNGFRVRPRLASFSGILGRRGYRTAAFVGNWTLKDDISGLGEHFQDYVTLLDRKRWFGLAKREATADDLNEDALAWLAEKVEEEPRRPFLLWVHYVEPHAPYRLRREFLDQLGLEGGTFSARKRYDSEIAYVDDRIGALLEAVDRLRGDSELVTVFVADHGESLGEHGYWGHGRHLYDVTLAIPMGIVWPGVIAPAEIEGAALITDLAPTLLGFAGQDVPEFFRGFDWGPVLRGESEEPEGRETLHQAHKSSVQPDEDHAKLRQRGLLEIARVVGTRKETFRVVNDRRRVFELAEDPLEKSSRVPLESAASPELAAWLEAVREGLAAADDLPPPSLTEEDLEALRALGYLD